MGHSTQQREGVPGREATCPALAGQPHLTLYHHRVRIERVVCVSRAVSGGQRRTRASSNPQA
uniref:Uncharacterized protein n=1 Tax=mine drainage metagenome TaxID=410659 RepID=E6PTA9_9ZZZZ